MQWCCYLTESEDRRAFTIVTIGFQSFDRELSIGACHLESMGRYVGPDALGQIYIQAFLDR
jgi:hypothetical protein